MSTQGNSYRTWLLKLNEQLKEYQQSEGITIEKLLEKLGFSDSSWRRRLEDPNYWKYSEILEVCKLLQLDDSPAVEHYQLLSQLRNKVKASPVKVEFVAEKIGLNYEKLNRRFNDIDLFTIEEVEKILILLRKFE